MRQIRVCGLHPHIYDVKTLLHSLTVCDAFDEENFIWDDKEPEYLFVSEWIYWNRLYSRRFRELADKAAVRIFLAGECIAPDMNIFDYAIVFDKKLHDMDRIVSRPTNLFFNIKRLSEGYECLTENEARQRLDTGLRFCNFLYSNSAAHPFRDKLFHALSEYKHVDSLGRHLNNINTLIVCRGNNKANFITGSRAGIQIKSKYKFSIAAENASYEGYTSEKILTSFLAHTVPVYWGNPYVAEEYNPEAFINCHNYDSFDAVIRRVKEVDENDDLWAYMASRPFQTEEQRRISEEKTDAYIEFMRNLFSQPLSKAVRRPSGCCPGWYSEWFFGHKIKANFMEKALRKIRRTLNMLKDGTINKTDLNDFFNEQGDKN